MFKIVKKIKSLQNRSIELYTNDLQGLNLFKTLILGAMHGDEPQGSDFLCAFLKKTHILKNSFYIIPTVNPDGKALTKRVNSNGTDLNRNFPTKNWVLTKKNEFFGGTLPASELETQFLIEVIDEIKPDLILTFHAPYKIVNYDGNALNHAKKIAKLIDYPIQKDIGYPTPGSFGTYCGIEKNIPTITLELDENAEYATIEKLCNKIMNYLDNITS